MVLLLNKEDQVDKDKLYENKLAQHNKKNADKNYGVSTNNKIAREVGNKIIQDGGNSADAAYGVAYTLAVTEPYAAGLGGEGTSLTYDGKRILSRKCMTTVLCPLITTRMDKKSVFQALLKGCMTCIKKKAV